MKRGAPSWWQRRGGVAAFLYPLSLLYRLLFLLHRLWQRGRRCALPVPVIVVGNITVGGSGKTPVVEALVTALTSRGVAVGIASRGYRSRAEKGAPELVTARDCERFGDEPVLLATRTGVPVVVGRDRCAAVAKMLAAHPHLDVVVCDDGLQHHRLPRAWEIAVVDPATLGNRWLLPAGPLREPLARLRRVAAILVRGAVNDAEAQRTIAALVGDGPLPPVWALPVEPLGLSPLAAWREGGESSAAGKELLPLSALAGKRVAAIAGIAHPDRFFALLTACGADVTPYPFPDHHPFAAEDLPPPQPDGYRIFTAKDAIKCARWAEPNDLVLEVRAKLPAALVGQIEDLLHGSTPPGNPGLPPL